MRPEWWFPLVMCILETGASGMYYWQADWRRGTYWLAALVITVVITW